jgi:hypothetical protein
MQLARQQRALVRGAARTVFVRRHCSTAIAEVLLARQGDATSANPLAFGESPTAVVVGIAEGLRGDARG